MLCGVNCALALLLEPVERQTDLVLFCSMHALRCTYLWLNKFNYVPRPTMSTVGAAHTAAWATIFFVYEVRPNTLRGIFASMLKFFIGDRKETHPETVNQKNKKSITTGVEKNENEKVTENGEVSKRSSSTGSNKRVKFSAEE